MIFHDKYELLALRGGDEEIALPGREISSGRDVLVHLLSAGYTIENRVLLRAIDKLPEEYRQKVLDKGDHDGIPYVITEVLPAKVKLRDWIAEAKAAPAQKLPDSPIKSGVWKVAPVPAPEKSPQPEVGEFTRLFQSVQAPPAAPQPMSQDDTPTAAIALPKLDEAPPGPAAPEPQPGEFTRMLRSAAPPPETKPAPPPPLAAPPEPGEFTRMFQAAVPPETRPATPPPPAPEPAAAPAPPPPAPAPPPAPVAAPRPLPAAAPGEFTRMMQSPLTPGPLRSQPSAPPQPASEFTRMMQAGQLPDAPPRQAPPPGPAPAARDLSLKTPGEFTRMFSTDPAPSESLAAPVEQAPLPQGGAATGAFSRRVTAPPPQAASGPSEFTQMFGRPAAAPAPKPPAPKPAAPPPSSPAQKSYLPLVLILAGLFILVVILIVVFSLTR